MWELGLLFFTRARDNRYRVAVFIVLLGLAIAPLFAFGASAPQPAKAPEISPAEKRLLACYDLQKQLRPDAKAVIAAFNAEPEGYVRKCLVEAAWRLDAAGRPVLLKGVKDADPQVRMSAAIGLSRLGAPEDTAALMAQAKGDKEVGVRVRAARGMGRLQGLSEADAAALAKDADPRVRAHAVEALADSDHPAADKILKDAGSDPDPEVKERVKKAAERRKARLDARKKGQDEGKGAKK